LSSQVAEATKLPLRSDIPKAGSAADHSSRLKRPARAVAFIPKIDDGKTLVFAHDDDAASGNRLTSRTPRR